jgi:hypothetical protein
LEKAVESFKAAATAYSGNPYEKIQAAKHWAALVEMESSRALSAYQVLIDLLPQTAWLGSFIKHRFEDIKTFVGDSVNAAVATAIAVKENKKAVEWLEQGRSIVWGQILSLRTPLDDLRDEHPELADNLEKISRMLEQGSMQELARDEHSLSLSLEQEARLHRRQAED